MRQIQEDIRKVLDTEYFIRNRVARLRELGYICEERPMGSGGVGSINETKKEIRIQIGYGHSKWNYAFCVIIQK